MFMFSTSGSIVLPFLCSHKGSSCRAVMPVGNVQSGHRCKLIGDIFYIFRLADYPKLMPESVNRCDEIVQWFSCRIAHNKPVEARIVRISKEYRLYVCIAGTYVFHTVFLLVLTGKLVLFNHTVHVIVNRGTYNKSILCSPLHCQGIDIIAFCVVLYKPSALLELFKLLFSTIISLGIKFRNLYSKVNFGLGNMIKRHFIISSLLTGFF